MNSVQLAAKNVSRRFFSGQSNRVSSAMNLFLSRHRKKQQFLNTKKAEFENGKKYLAKMMNIESESMTKDDITEAIDYLFPSGLFDKKARPQMVEPESIYKVETELDTSPTGRPSHFLFYTGKPKYFGMMHDIGMKVEELMLKEVPQSSPRVLMDKKRIWNLDDLQRVFCDEEIDAHDYKAFEKLINRLIILPDSGEHTEFIYKYCCDKISTIVSRNIPELQTDANGIKFAIAFGKKKHKTAEVKVMGKGNGKITINGTKDLLYFHPLYRAAIISPLLITGQAGRVDIEATVPDNKASSASAFRHAIANCLASLASSEYTTELMRQSGMLTRDKRHAERKKPGQKGPRAKYPWRKR